MLDTHQKLLAAAVLLIAGLGGGFWLGRTVEPTALSRPSSTAPTPPATLPPASQGAVLTGANAIAVNDQAPGLTVAISLVALGQDGWMVIHESEAGAPGRILGARRFNTGQASGSVELLRPTEEGRVYFAMLHADDGDRQFDHTKDLPVNDPQGNAILMRFIATANPAAE